MDLCKELFTQIPDCFLQIITNGTLLDKITDEDLEYLSHFKVSFAVTLYPKLKYIDIVQDFENRCKKYDVVLFKRNDNKYVLHRIIKVNKNDYTIRGDNCVYKEYGVKDEDILGVITSFIRKGKEYTVDNKFYRIYSVLWCKLYFLRRVYKRLFVIR